MLADLDKSDRMKTRRIVFGVILLCAVLVVVLQLYRNSHDPVVNGKRLSVWINEFDIWKGPSTEAATTLESSGAAAEELLIEMLQRRDSRFILTVDHWMSKQSFIQFRFESAQKANERALNVCNLLGQKVSGTIPAIAQLISQEPYALGTLALMGTNGARALALTLTHRQASERDRAAQLLATMNGSGSVEVIRALEAASREPDPGPDERFGSSTLVSSGIARTAASSLAQLRARNAAFASSGDHLVEGSPPDESPPSVWDVARGIRIVSHSPLYPGCRPEDLFGSLLSSVGTPETGSAIFDDSQPDGFVHFIEWETSTPVTVRSFGVIGAHETALLGFIRAFRGFRLYAQREGDTGYSLLYDETVPVPYGSGFCGSLLVRFRNLQSAVTARRFRVEFIQNGSGTYHGARAVELYGFDVPLSKPLIRSALQNQEPVIRDGVLRVLGIGP